MPLFFGRYTSFILDKPISDQNGGQEKGEEQAAHMHKQTWWWRLV